MPWQGMMTVRRGASGGPDSGMERAALEHNCCSVVKRVCLHPVPLPPEGSQTAGHRNNPGKKRPGLTRHPPARLRKRRQGDGMETDGGSSARRAHRGSRVNTVRTFASCSAAV
jgi:hypothetical protein